jgi:SAM-dependent methyltransferase
MNALEISGTKWANLGFNCYRSIDYPDYDICSGPLEPAGFDIIIAEQVFEHILWPYRAVKNVYTMLKPGGVFVVTTPFLLRIHNCPVDCSRWTPLGLRHLLAEGGFPLESTESHSWGNRACVRSNFRDWRKWTVWLHSLKNEHDFPVVVWAYATKPKSAK